MLRDLFTQAVAGVGTTARARGMSAAADELVPEQDGVDRPVAGWHVRDSGGAAVNGELWTRQPTIRRRELAAGAAVVGAGALALSKRR